MDKILPYLAMLPLLSFIVWLTWDDEIYRKALLYTILSLFTIISFGWGVYELTR